MSVILHLNINYHTTHKNNVFSLLTKETHLDIRISYVATEGDFKQNCQTKVLKFLLFNLFTTQLLYVFQH